MFSKILIFIAASVALTLSQRPSYAGRRPIGYPELSSTTTTQSTPNPDGNALGNRFGNDQTSSTTSTTTMRLPIEALGDQDLVRRLSQMPIDKQPFWFINWKALEANRRNPQTHPLKPNTFIPQSAFQKWA